MNIKIEELHQFHPFITWVSVRHVPPGEPPWRLVPQREVGIIVADAQYLQQLSLRQGPVVGLAVHGICTAPWHAGGAAAATLE